MRLKNRGKPILIDELGVEHDNVEIDEKNKKAYFDYGKLTVEDLKEAAGVVRIDDDLRGFTPVIRCREATPKLEGMIRRVGGRISPLDVKRS